MCMQESFLGPSSAADSHLCRNQSVCLTNKDQMFRSDRRLCCLLFHLQRLSQFSSTLAAENLALAFATEPGFVTIFFRHSSLSREPNAQVQSANSARSHAARRAAWNRNILC